MKRGAIISDLHGGSIYGMLPPGFKTYQDIEVNQHVGQQYLWNCWLNFCARTKEFDPDFIIANGDMVDGLQRKNKGAELSLIAPADQSSAAIGTLKVLKESVRPECKWYFTQGTPYHVGVWGDREEDVAHALGGQRYPSVGTGKLCREVLWLGVEGIVIEASHHISVPSGFYRLTPLDREAQWSAMAAKDDTQGIPKATLLIRSHVHFFSYGEHASKQIVTTPCWQLQTRYMRKHSVYRMIPNIGGLFLTVDGEARKKGEAPCQITKVLYDLPPVRVTPL